uniref:Uncharacterized protein n=1 Tax=Oryza rufipogon TaxID=4529 RepID=A0A0E0RAN9_ORYRU
MSSRRIEKAVERRRPCRCFPRRRCPPVHRSAARRLCTAPPPCRPSPAACARLRTARLRPPAAACGDRREIEGAPHVPIKSQQKSNFRSEDKSPHRKDSQ